MTRETLEHGEDPVSEPADKNNGRHIFDLVIKVNKSFSFKVVAHNLIRKITDFLCFGQKLRN